MTDPTPAEALKAGEIVDALFADLRSRKFLKYLFAEEPNSCGAYGYIDSPFDLDVQQEIADAWRAIVAAALSPPDAGEVRTYREGVQMVCAAFEEAISKGYPTPANNRDQCAHGSFGWQDCIACYDDALTASIAAIRKLP